MPIEHLNIDPENLEESLSKLSPDDRRWVRQEALVLLARGDDLVAFAAFCEVVHDWVLEPHHLEWAAYLIAGKPVCIVAPPGTGKSRLVQCWLQWEIGRHPDNASMFIQNTLKQAKKPVNAVKSVIERNKVYRRIFPDVKPTDDWAKDAITVTRETYRQEETLASFGIDGAYQGLHVENIIIDDPTDQEDVQSEPKMMMQRNLVSGVIKDRLNEGGNLFIILTRWHPEDLVKTFEEMGVTIIVYPAWKPWNTPYAWDTGPFDRDLPEDEQRHGASLLSKKWASYTRLKTLQNFNRPLFKLTYLCEPEGAIRGTKVFAALHSAAHLRPVRADIPWAHTALGVDFGTTQRHQSALVVVSKARHGLVVARAAWMSPEGSQAEIAAEAGNMRTNYGVHGAYIDKSQQSLVDVFRHNLGIYATTGERSVEMRIGALLTLIDTGAILFDINGPGVQLLWSQIESYSRDEYGHIIEVGDDLVDAFLYAVCGLAEPAKSGILKPAEIREQRSKTAVKQDADGGWHDSFDPKRLGYESGVNVRTPEEWGRLL